MDSLWRRLSDEPPPPSLGIKSGTVRIVGPAKSRFMDHSGEILAVNRGAFYADPDVWVSKHTEAFRLKDLDCLKISGDTWTKPGIEQWRLSAVWFSGVFAMLVAKLLGYERILIFGMPADYSVPALGSGGNDAAQKPGWAKYREYFDGVTVYGGNLPKWFPELRRSQ